MLKRLLGMTDEQRQTLTTLSMMGGIVALTVCSVLMVILIRTLPSALILAQAETYVSGLFNILYGLLALMGIQVIAQATIAIGGKLKGTFGPASFEAEAENVTIKTKGPIDAGD